MKRFAVFLVFGLLLAGFTVAAADNPDITKMYAEPNNPYVGAQFSIYVRAEDNDGIDRIQFYNDGSYSDVEYCDDDTCSVYFTVYESTSGYHTYMVKVYDDDGDRTTESLTVYVRYATGAIPPYGGWCGDGTCASGETCSSCPADCGSCNYCGNGICSGGETCSSCPADCGQCSYCGDGRCSGTESCSSCPADCGLCSYCGDSICSSSESCSSCPGDCGSCVVVPVQPVYTCQQRGGQCCAYGGSGAIDGAADCPSTCFSQCNAAPSDNGNQDTGTTGAVIAGEGSLIIVVILLVILFLLIAVLLRR